MAFFLFSLMLKPGQTGTAVWGMGNCFPSECSMPQRVRGLGKRIYALWGGRRGNLRSPPIAALKQFSLLPAWSGGYPTRKEGFLW